LKKFDQNFITRRWAEGGWNFTIPLPGTASWPVSVSNAGKITPPLRGAFGTFDTGYLPNKKARALTPGLCYAL